MLTRLSRVSHLFSKVMVVVCVVGGGLCCVWAFRILSRTGQDSAALLGVALGFFGGELAILFAKTALSNKAYTRKEHDND